MYHNKGKAKLKDHQFYDYSIPLSQIRTIKFDEKRNFCRRIH